MYRVVLSRAALADLDDLFEWIAGRAGVVTAFSYTDRLRDYCLGFSRFPNRGTRRDSVRPGLRTVGYRRQALIAFIVREDEVVILRILYGGRNLDDAFSPDFRRASAEER